MAKKTPLDIYDDIPREMRAYLSHNGWHFNKRACELATGLMRKKSPASGKMERIEPYTREQVEDMLKKYGVTIEDTSNYDFVFIANMCKADYLKSSVPDEQHLALFVKDTLSDPDAGDGVTMRRWYATMVANGEMVDWAEMM
jgi:hypothetical protein